MVLRNGRQPLVQEKLEAEVVRPDKEAAPPEVRPPVSDGVNQPDELPLVGGEGAVTWGDGAAEVGHRVLVMDEHHPETMCGGIMLNDEFLGEVRQRQHWG